jgi:hypothetical protein
MATQATVADPVISALPTPRHSRLARVTHTAHHPFRLVLALAVAGMMRATCLSRIAPSASFGSGFACETSDAGGRLAAIWDGSAESPDL